MSTRLVVTFAVLGTLLAAPAFAALGDVVGSFRAPGTSVRGLARSSTRLHILIYGNPTTIYRLAPVSGAVYGSWQPSFGNNCRGLAFSTPNRLWVGCYSDDRVYECRSTNGSVFGSWNAANNAYGVAPYCTGDGGAGTTAIFTSDTNPTAFCWRHNMVTGSVLASFPTPVRSFFDIAWDHRNRLIWMGDLSNVIYGYDTAGSVAASFPAPATYPYGMAYYGQYLWVGCDGNDYVYRVHCPGTLAVAPASLGRVKALFR
ncbi:MAG: hypothetical protein JSU81_06630 [Candidatus Coatesbacteria bacterium]|nr:MAG: hypothetical protein JSU81_06630 [Candidatus Coatesbacteria bacterium]